MCKLAPCSHLSYLSILLSYVAKPLVARLPGEEIVMQLHCSLIGEVRSARYWVIWATCKHRAHLSIAVSFPRIHGFDRFGAFGPALDTLESFMHSQLYVSCRLDNPSFLVE